jgi:hypothetical protein
MDKEPVRHTKNVAALVLGVVFIGTPLYLVMGDRSPVAETTNFRINPSTVYPGQRVETVRTAKTLRTGCNEGVVFQTIVSRQGAAQQVFSFLPIPPSRLFGPVGTTREYHSRGWEIPVGVQPGMNTLVQVVYRGCNWLQKAVWPLREDRMFDFMVVARPTSP